MKRIGIVGCGSVADFGHGPAMTQNPDIVLAAAFDPNRDRVEAFCQKFGVPAACTDIEAFYDQRLDAVVIASPPSTHLANAVAAAKHGCDVLCEKPLADTEEASKELARQVRQLGRKLYVGFVYRFSPVSQQIKKWISDGTAGEIRSLRLIYDWDLHGEYMKLPSGEWVESPMWRGRMEEGGPLMDCGVHQIDLARWWLGSEVASWQSVGGWVANYDAPDHQFLHLRHANGVLTNIEVSFTFGHTARDPFSVYSYHLIGTGGILRYERDGYILEAHTGSGTLRVPGASEKNFPGMYEAFVHALETGEPGDLATPEDGIVATSIATEATAAAIEAKPA